MTLPLIGPLLIELHVVEASQPLDCGTITAIHNGSPIWIGDSSGGRDEVDLEEGADQLVAQLGRRIPDLRAANPAVARRFDDTPGSESAWRALLYDLGTYEGEMLQVDRQLRFGSIERLEDAAHVSVVRDRREGLMSVPLDKPRLEALPYELASAWLAGGLSYRTWQQTAL